MASGAVAYNFDDGLGGAGFCLALGAAVLGSQGDGVGSGLDGFSGVEHACVNRLFYDLRDSNF